MAGWSSYATVDSIGMQHDELQYRAVDPRPVRYFAVASLLPLMLRISKKLVIKVFYSINSGVLQQWDVM